MPETIRRYFILIKMDADEAVLWDEKLTEVLNSLPHTSKTQSYATVFVEGVEALERERAGGFSEEHQRRLAVDTKLRTLVELRARDKKLDELYGELGFDAFVEWCDENDVDWESFFQRHQPTERDDDREPRWSETALSWLSEFLVHPRSTTEIREQAVHRGLINGGNRDWGKLRALACRAGFTRGDRGIWSLPENPPRAGDATITDYETVGRGFVVTVA